MRYLTISIDREDRPRFDRLMNFLESQTESQNAGVQNKLDQAAASLKQTGDEIEASLTKEN